ncbi:cytochrome P450 like protein [Zymoseptoria brevis]|uniref:Cytochrome P450 like protein n=1 Tax=Zymoseptoria brevis TaxID=1047168 RepID=A0A0F4GKY5_9PEZI|nr:cytochrome P450 like protein [Zymoseptoria brevis]
MLGNSPHILDLVGLHGIALGIIGACLTALFFTRVCTTIKYRQACTQSENESTIGLLPSPLIPYSIPWIGHSWRFLEKNANRWYHRQSLSPPNGVYSMVIGGRRTHIVTNRAATRYLFRHPYAQGLTRATFVKDLLIKCLLVSPQDTSVINTGEGRKQQEDVFHKYLARREAVTELTSTFSGKLLRSHEEISNQNPCVENIGLYAWLRRRLYSASLTAFFGEELVRMYPEVSDDIFGFDEDLCSFFFDFPRILNRAAWTRRRRILNKLMAWDTMIHEMNKGPPGDPLKSTAWDPVFGSRFNKARLLLYDSLGLSIESRAGMNLSIMFALASNVVPATGWMLFHILGGSDSESLLTSVRAEVDSATKSDQTLDIPVLLSASPLLSSVWTEVLRHYCDNMIMREVVESTAIPLEDHGSKWFKVDKGDMIISPCWVAHHESAYWQEGGIEQSPSVFVADRFVGNNLSDAKAKALAGTPNAKMYPFGGGKSICAGRIFAKEEALVAVAQTLSKFDIVVHGFLDGQGKPTSSFPGLTPSLPGVVVYPPEGDLLVSMRKRAPKL